MGRISIENIKIEMSLRRWVLLSPAYQNLDGELEMLCPEGHKVFMSLKQWRKKQECPTCSANVYSSLQETTAIQKKAGVKRTLSLDDSTSITGWAVFDNEVLVGYGKIEMTQKDAIERISGMRQWLLSTLVKWKPDVIGIEDIQQQQNVQIFKVLAQFQGVLLNTLFENKYHFEIIHVATWRSYCGVKGKDRATLKKAAQAKVKEWYDVTVTQDEADAICMGRYVIKNVSKNNEFFGWE